MEFTVNFNTPQGNCVTQENFLSIYDCFFEPSSTLTEGTYLNVTAQKENYTTAISENRSLLIQNSLSAIHYLAF